MTTEPIGTPTPDDAGIDPDVIDELADDDDAPIDVRTAKRLRSEARKLRHRLRESEANRQATEEARAGDLARLANLERRAVEHTVEDVLADPSDLWLHTDEATQQSFVDR
jgi:hypothetical protein